MLCSLALPVSALPQARIREPGRGFERLSDSGAGGVVMLAFDANDYRRLAERHAQESAITLDKLPLPGGLEARLELRPVDALAPGARAQIVAADGSVTLLEPTVRCFSGYVEGGGPAFLGITADALQGYLSFAGETYFVSAGDRPGFASVAHSSETAGALDAVPCGLERQPRELAPEALPEALPEAAPARVRIVVPTLRVADIELDLLRALWRPISPHWFLERVRDRRTLLVYARYDLTFPVDLSQDLVKEFRARGIPHELAVLSCGHYSTGKSPFKFIDGWLLTRFLKNALLSSP